MATPVPVVSMMYFFVFSPPKMTGAVSPACCAISVKCATGLAFALWEFPVATLGEPPDGRESQAQSPRKQKSRNREEWRVIPSLMIAKVWSDKSRHVTGFEANRM